MPAFADAHSTLPALLVALWATAWDDPGPLPTEPPGSAVWDVAGAPECELGLSVEEARAQIGALRERVGNFVDDGVLGEEQAAPLLEGAWRARTCSWGTRRGRPNGCR